MKRRIQVFGLLAIAWLGAPASASAVTLYSTGFLDPAAPFQLGVVTWGGSSTLDNQPTGVAEFSLEIDALLTSITVWTYDTTDGTSATFEEIRYGIYSDSSLSPGSLLASGLGTITVAQEEAGHRFISPPGGSMLTLVTVFDVTPLSLTAGQDYWLTLVGRTAPSGVSNNARWAFAADTEGGAFALQGVPVSVPEPSTALLFGAALLVVRIGRARRTI